MFTRFLFQFKNVVPITAPSVMLAVVAYVERSAATFPTKLIAFYSIWLPILKATFKLAFLFGTNVLKDCSNSL